MEEKMKVQVPSVEQIMAWLNDDDHGFESYELKQIFELAIAWANEQLLLSPPTKRPFLSDLEIEDEVKDFDYAEDRELYRTAARWARDKYEARDGGDVPHVEPKWQPVVGQLCRTWGNTENTPVRTGYFVKTHDGDSHEFTFEGSTWECAYCALIETLDEIGKPPSYFQERGRCTV
jgi:hypothetical protein